MHQIPITLPPNYDECIHQCIRCMSMIIPPNYDKHAPHSKPYSSVQSHSPRTQSPYEQHRARLITRTLLQSLRHNLWKEQHWAVLHKSTIAKAQSLIEQHRAILHKDSLTIARGTISMQAAQGRYGRTNDGIISNQNVEWFFAKLSNLKISN